MTESQTGKCNTVGTNNQADIYTKCVFFKFYIRKFGV